MAKFVAKGTLLQVSDNGPEGTYATIPQVGDIDGPGGDTSEIDVTDHDSPGGTDEFLPGTIDPGDVTFVFHYDPAAALHSQLIADQQGQVVRWYQVVYTRAANKTFRFQAYPSRVRQAAPVKGALAWQGALRVAGQITEVPPPSQG